jgi:hypothetical protein
MKSQPRKKSPSAPDRLHRRGFHILVASLASVPLIALAGNAGQITHLSGTLSAKRADGSSKLLAVKSEVLEGDTLSTEAETFARIKFSDGGEVVMRPGTQLKIENYNYVAGKPESDNVVMNMFKGGLRAVTGLVGKRNREKVTFQTETATHQVELVVGAHAGEVGQAVAHGEEGGDGADVPHRPRRRSRGPCSAAMSASPTAPDSSASFMAKSSMARWRGVISALR